jgi:hypothetical protein
MTSYPAPDIYHRIRGGHGSASFQNNSDVTDQQADLQGRINTQVKQLNTKMNSAWQGNASDQAVSGAGPLATSSNEANGSLTQASGAMNDQVGAFHSAYNNVVEMPASAPPNNMINEMVSGLGVNTPLDQQISTYNTDGQHNVQVYNNYSSQSASNAAQMPTSFDNLPTAHPTISVVSPSGSTSGGTAFTGSSGPTGGGSTGGSSYVPPGGGARYSGSSFSPSGGGSYTPPPSSGGGGPTFENPNGPGTTTTQGFEPGGPVDGGPAFNPVTGVGGPPGEGPGGWSSGPGGGWPGEDEFPGGGFPGGNGPNGGVPFGESEGFAGGGGGFGGQGGYGGQNGYNGRFPGGAGGAGGFGGAGGSGGAGGTGSAGTGGPNSGSGVSGAEEAAMGRNSMLAGTPGEPGSGMGGPMGAGRGAKGEEDKEHKTAEYLQEADPDALFGSDQLTVPRVIGE